MAYTILIIDAEPMLTDLLSEHLTHHGYRTHTANNSALRRWSCCGISLT